MYKGTTMTHHCKKAPNVTFIYYPFLINKKHYCKQTNCTNYTSYAKITSYIKPPSCQHLIREKMLIY